MDTAVDSALAEDENYTEPIATSTPAPNHPHFGINCRSNLSPSLDDLTEIVEEKEESLDVDTDYNLKRLRLKIKKCTSMAKLLVVLMNNKSTIEKREKGKFDECVRKVNKFKKKRKEAESDSEKRKLLRKMKLTLIRDLNLKLDDKSVEQKQVLRPKGKKIMFSVSSKKELRQAIKDAAKKRQGMKKLQQKITQNKRRFAVAGQTYKMKSSSVEKFQRIVRMLEMKKNNPREEWVVLVNKLFTLFKQEISGTLASGGDCKPKRKKNLKQTSPVDSSKKDVESAVKKKSGSFRKKKKKGIVD